MTKAKAKTKAETVRKKLKPLKNCPKVQEIYHETRSPPLLDPFPLLELYLSEGDLSLYRMNRSTLTIFLFSALACLTLSSCGFVSRNTIGLFSSETDTHSIEPPKPIKEEKASTVKVEKLDLESVSGPNNVEVIWAIPKDPVDGFVIHYGYSQGKLDFETRLSSTEIERYEDPKYGYVYRHVLEDIPPQKPVYVSISAFSNTAVSAPSEAMSLPPEKK